MSRAESEFLRANGEIDDADDDVERSEEPGDPEPELQAVDPRGARFRRLSRRICLIRRDDASESTGFLVGPDLMFTAAHNLLGTAGIFADPAEVTILFDQFLWNRRTRTMAYGDQCRLRHLPFRGQPDVVASSIKTDKLCKRIKFDNGLDYVLVRLDRPIGLSFLPFSHRMRGWNDCNVANARAEGDVFVVQHPLGGLQKFAKGTIPDGHVPERRVPFLYTTQTLSGASGSPVYNERRQVVGLHIGERVEPDGSARQLGVSFQDIFEDIRDEGVHLPAGPPLQETMDTVFGRSDIERRRKGGRDWRGDRLFDNVS